MNTSFASQGEVRPRMNRQSVDAESSAPADRDSVRCRRVEDALYRRACGYKIKLKKTFKVKVVEYDPDTGKKITEREDLKDGFEEVHVPADMRVGAYYLNNRAPDRWREHPREDSEESEENSAGIVEGPEVIPAEE